MWTEDYNEFGPIQGVGGENEVHWEEGDTVVYKLNDFSYAGDDLTDFFDPQFAQDLLDTLMAHRESCVGMAANMIGIRKRVIIINMGLFDIVMFNPVLLKKDTPYEIEEGCLSLEGVRRTVRYQNIEVEYYDMNWKKQRQKLSGWTAQICQHELDHLEGILI